MTAEVAYTFTVIGEYIPDDEESTEEEEKGTPS